MPASCRTLSSLLASLLLATLGAGGPAAAQATFVNEVVVPGITNATTMAFLPDGRMLVGELTRTIWVVQPGANAPDPTPFLQLGSTGLVAEQGLMDILPDPNFATNQFYYVYYTRVSGGSFNYNRVSRFTASGNTTVPNSEFVLWEDNFMAGGEHHGGTLAIGNDGKLYFTVGDAGFPFPPQDLTYFGGKVLRINLDGTVPTDNPFYDGAGPNKDAIWAMGLRNPFRMSIDPVTGRMYIGDVGDNSTTSSVEEVNLGARGANYGWPQCEGSCALAGRTNPLFEAVHPGHSSAIVSGPVYRGSQFPAQYVGSYFYADYSENVIRRLVFNADGSVNASLPFWPADGHFDDDAVGDPVKLVVGPDGALYYVDIGFDSHYNPNPAAIRRIRFVNGNLPPVCVASADPLSGAAPLSVAFSSAGSFDPEGAPLSFLWAFGDGGLSIEANPQHAYVAAGPYTARLTASDGTNTTLSNELHISVGSPPVATIAMPTDGWIFRGGDVITFSGSAVDPEQGALPSSALSWTILFHHEDHIHPGGTFDGTAAGTLVIPTSGHDFSGNTHYEIVLTATDATGLRDVRSVTVFPQKVNLSFATQPAGLSVDIDGVRKTTPLVVDSLVGFAHTIAAPPQTQLGTSYAFASWSDGGARSHGVVTPATAQSYTAQFQVTAATPGLVAAYSFDDGVGASVVDDSGNGNDAALGGAAWLWSGRQGGAVQFAGAGSPIAIPDSPSLDLTSGMTLMAWVRPSASAAAPADLIVKEDSQYFLQASSPEGRPAVGGAFHPLGPLRAPSALPPNQWTHLAGTYDGANLRLYVNAVEVAAQPLTGAIPPSSQPLSLGGHSVYGERFTGAMDEVRIYDRALSASEVQAAMNRSIRTAPPPPGCGLGPELLVALPLLGWLRRRAR